MPLSSNQLAALVDRARLKSPPVVSPSPPPPAPQRSVPLRRVTPAPQAQAAARPTSKAGTPQQTKAAAVAPLPPTAAPQPESIDDFPTGWELKKGSWHFHRRFYAVFKRPMRHGEYSHLLWQIRRRTAEHLWEDCWRVTLPGGGRTLPVRATRWHLITILPKNWQPPAVASASSGSDHAQEPGL